MMRFICYLFYSALDTLFKGTHKAGLVGEVGLICEELILTVGAQNDKDLEPNLFRSAQAIED